MNNLKIKLGLLPGTVALQEYTDAWQADFAQEYTRIRCHLPSFVGVEIEHIGGTSIPGMLAKPIIDIAIGLNATYSIEYVVNTLLLIGYIDRGMYGRDGGVRFLQLKSEDGKVTHHIHLTYLADENWTLALKFRDTLTNRQDLREQLCFQKKKLAESFADNRKQYTGGKSNFIDLVHDYLRNSKTGR